MKESIKRYYSLTKPGVLYGNVLTAAAGFFFASAHNEHFNIVVFLAMLTGTTLVIASACVLNNYLDQDIDKIMERTQNRALVAGTLPGYRAVLFSISLGVIGLLILWLYTNLLVVTIGVIGFITYVVLYGMLSKRLSIHGTLVGSISGAMPIVAGYVAATNQIDLGAIILFVILFAWQFPEFYSIAIYRLREYKAARIPVLPIIKGMRRTKIEILIYTIIYVAGTVTLSLTGYTGIIYLVVMASLGVYWIILAIKGFKATDDDAWARQMFGFSMISILSLCVMLSVGPLLP